MWLAGETAPSHGCLIWIHGIVCRLICGAEHKESPPGNQCCPYTQSDSDPDDVKAVHISIKEYISKPKALDLYVRALKDRKGENFMHKLERAMCPTNNQSRLMLILGLQDNWIISVDLNFYFFYVKNE